jgi:hypothetical protein
LMLAILDPLLMDTPHVGRAGAVGIGGICLATGCGG